MNEKEKCTVFITVFLFVCGVISVFCNNIAGGVFYGLCLIAWIPQKR